MKRKKVYKAIDSERDYQDRQTADPNRPDMVEDFGIGQAILAMEHNLAFARSVWYIDDPNSHFVSTMDYLRKVVAIGVKMGEKYGMPFRFDETATG